ncbi:LysR substrate-binding domain-containing protein [Dokdonella sp.]|uniref:LysR substrate-binding domain-containing protein n=1 Tax=Dokdonella sp. TaxID=2291710 RepID=UPI0031C20E2D|nr:LysR substrate-binding domain-containing protein [Dokdonella sp.]
MTLTQLRCIAAIADAGLNITLAAERVHATQPGLSKQLRQLEDALGFQVFSRRGRSLTEITPQGGQVLERARVILAEAANIRALAANLRSDAQGELNIATTHTQARFVLPAAVAALKKRYPAVSVHLKPHGDAEVMERLARGQVDLAIISTSGGEPSADGLAVPLFRWRRAVVVPRPHPLARAARPPTLAQLATYPLVSYESSLRPDSSLRLAFADTGLVPSFACTARDADLIKTYVRAGLGVGVLAEMALTPGDAADLVALDAAQLFPECTTWLVLRRDRVLRNHAAALVERVAPQIDGRELRRVLAGNAPARWPPPPTWQALRARWPVAAT